MMKMMFRPRTKVAATIVPAVRMAAAFTLRAKKE